MRGRWPDPLSPPALNLEHVTIRRTFLQTKGRIGDALQIAMRIWGLFLAPYLGSQGALSYEPRLCSSHAGKAGWCLHLEDDRQLSSGVPPLMLYGSCSDDVGMPTGISCSPSGCGSEEAPGAIGVSRYRPCSSGANHSQCASPWQPPTFQAPGLEPSMEIRDAVRMDL